MEQLGFPIGKEAVYFCDDCANVAVHIKLMASRQNRVDLAESLKEQRGDLLTA